MPKLGAGGKADGPGRLGPVGDVGTDALRLIVAYLKQETLGPLRGVARFVAFGVAGSVALSAGAVLLLLAVLRVLQDETAGAFSGSRSWLPYLVVVVLALALLALAAWRVVRGPARRRPSEGTSLALPATEEH